MLTKLATTNYSKIPKHLYPIVGGLLVLGILWLSLSLSVSAKNEIYSFEKNDFLMASTLVAQSEFVGHKSTIVLNEYSVTLWNWFCETNFESIFIGLSFFVLFSVIYFISAIFLRSYILNLEHCYSILLNWIKSIQASTS
ncbi:hypothetical protein E2650_10800 [Shewanella xiamenensis]|uniref:Uncharacterized protein n=1 Tax=Shewanella xiamenensis TaxID=332186 RepID=A0AAW6QX80_9GAMM|nr:MULTISPECIES: hypothetical protein [Shewanella]KPN75249.1 hypothetical protein AEA42_20690 [Shewanella sp. Sh95]MDG5900362.1 hypothetical protein [Shewanella xiamenensis]MDI5832679.1 hypothetical protein [Shewanella xiamenensis]